MSRQCTAKTKKGKGPQCKRRISEEKWLDGQRDCGQHPELDEQIWLCAQVDAKVKHAKMERDQCWRDTEQLKKTFSELQSALDQSRNREQECLEELQRERCIQARIEARIEAAVAELTGYFTTLNECSRRRKVDKALQQEGMHKRRTPILAGVRRFKRRTLSVLSKVVTKDNIRLALSAFAALEGLF